MTARHRKLRGRPLGMLLAVAMVWIGARALMWESPFPVNVVLPSFADANAIATSGKAGDDLKGMHAPLKRNVALQRSYRPYLSNELSDPVSDQSPLQPPPLPLYSTQRPADHSGHQMLYSAAMGDLPVADTVLASWHVREDAMVRAISTSRRTEQPGQWSLDGWLFLREGSGSPLLTTGPSRSYGGSQAGAVLSYRLAQTSAPRPRIYARLTKALGGSREADLALGTSLAPAAGLPLAAHAELRATRVSGRTLLRPQAFVVIQDSAKLPLDFRAQGYGQAGYVGGEFATAFADGQLRVDRETARFDLGTLRAGGGVWGGAQEGAARLDVGPTVDLGMDIAQTAVRLSLDYRHRVAGDAQPGSGVALTLSTGF